MWFVVLGTSIAAEFLCTFYTCAIMQGSKRRAVLWGTMTTVINTVLVARVVKQEGEQGWWVLVALVIGVSLGTYLAMLVEERRSRRAGLTACAVPVAAAPGAQLLARLDGADAAMIEAAVAHVLALRAGRDGAHPDSRAPVDAFMLPVTPASMTSGSRDHLDTAGAVQAEVVVPSGLHAHRNRLPTTAGRAAGSSAREWSGFASVPVS